MLNKINFSFGSSKAAKPLELEPSSVVVFVGPNNSGKSLILRELMSYVKKGGVSQDFRIISSLDVPAVDEDTARNLLVPRINYEKTAALAKGSIYVSSNDPITGEGVHFEIPEKEAFSYLCKPDPGYRKYALQYIYVHYIISLDGGTRLSMLKSRSAAGELQHPTHILGRIFSDDLARQKIRDIGWRAFGKYFVIDPTSMSNFDVRLSNRSPDDSLEEQALNDRARNFHADAMSLSLASDGVKAYLGLISAVTCSDHKLLLIDEPEAFLHPPLAKDLGKEISSVASQKDGYVFASTHSAHFLMGVVESGVDVDIVRLTYDGEQGTARVLKSADLVLMMRDPLLRSTGMLSALFHSAAIICEGDLDRAAYAEIDRRLEEAGLPSCRDAIFLSSHGKDALHRLVAPLRRLGIPAVAIADLDMVQEGLFGELLKSCGLPDGVWQAKRDVAARVSEACRAAGGLKLKETGIAGAPEDVKHALTVLVRELADWGLFLVPVGELELWLRNLHIKSSTKRGWLYSFFEKIGSEKSADNYLKPSDEDVWVFLKLVAKWVGDSERYGMPI